MATELGFNNPYRPGAGHLPPYLAGREREYADFERLLDQDVVLENVVLTGIRGVGKTVLLDTFKPRALRKGWLWVGTDLSESVSVSEETLAIRLLADLAVVTSTLTVDLPERTIGFSAAVETSVHAVNFDLLRAVYGSAPGLVADKLKAVLTFAWEQLAAAGKGRVVFAYDEAQNLSDSPAHREYPLSTLLDVFQFMQRQGAPFLLVLTGLPTLFPKLVDTRTYTERMFHVMTLGRLTPEESRDAILKPLDVAKCPIRFNKESVGIITRESGGYPYFIQFICREVFDVFIQQMGQDQQAFMTVEAIQRKLDSDFFAGRWNKATDRQRQLLYVIANLKHADDEFTIHEIVAMSQNVLVKPFSPSQSNQMLVALGERELIYKNRFGKYSFAVPLLGEFILRTYSPPEGGDAGAGLARSRVAQ